MRSWAEVVKCILPPFTGEVGRAFSRGSMGDVDVAIAPTVSQRSTPPP